MKIEKQKEWNQQQERINKLLLEITKNLTREISEIKHNQITRRRLE